MHQILSTVLSNLVTSLLVPSKPHVSEQGQQKARAGEGPGFHFTVVFTYLSVVFTLDSEYIIMNIEQLFLLILINCNCP